MKRFLTILRRYQSDRSVAKARIDLNAKCPGCGHERGRIEFCEKQRVMLHFCLVCGARWGEQTVVNVDAWLKKPETGPKRVV